MDVSISNKQQNSQL